VHRRHHVHHVRQEHEVRHPVVHAYIFAKQTRWVHIYSISFFRSCMPLVYTDLLLLQGRSAFRLSNNGELLDDDDAVHDD
jgi:hypothetical protein